MDFCAVRGELTRKRVEKMTGRTLDIPTSDAGLLASELLEVKPEKCYDVGIIPHLCDLKDPRVSELIEKYAGKFINVKDEPMKVIEEIARCRCVLSSSLHGLIVADSLGIPNLHVVFGDRLLGDGYKFDDYYSAYGMTHTPYDLRTERLPELSMVEDRYSIRKEAVAEKKRALKEVFPFPVTKE